MALKVDFLVTGGAVGGGGGGARVTDEDEGFRLWEVPFKREIG